MRGAIVTAAGSTGIVWTTVSKGVHVLPIVTRKAGRHRSDVRTEHGTVRTGAGRLVHSKLTVVGYVSQTLLAQLEASFQRESATRATEERWAQTARGTEQWQPPSKPTPLSGR